MSGQVVITVEYKDTSKPSKTSKPMWPDEAVGVMRDVCFRVACGEFVAAYVAEHKPIDLRPLKKS